LREDRLAALKGVEVKLNGNTGRMDGITIVGPIKKKHVNVTGLSSQNQNSVVLGSLICIKGKMEKRLKGVEAGVGVQQTLLGK